MMEKFIKGIGSWGLGVGVAGLLLTGATARAQDASELLSAPDLPPYQWFASTDPKNQNADYILLKPGETKRVPLASGKLLRLWSTAFKPDQITIVLQNGSQRVELLSKNKAKLGELYQKAFTLYPDEKTPAAVRELKNAAVLVATNNSKEENKWFYQVTVRPGTASKTASPSSTATPSASAETENIRFDASKVDEILRVPAGLGQKTFQLPVDAKTPYRLMSASGSARSQKGKMIPILKVKGKGAFVGLALDIRPAPDTTRRTFAFLEGNEFLIADGKTYEGTGTEDYFNSAWYYPEKPFTRSYHGMTFKGFEPPRVTTYRWMVTDAVPFKNSFEFQLEHGNGNNSDDLEYRWVAFWYQQAPFDFEIKDELSGSQSSAVSGASGASPLDEAGGNNKIVLMFGALAGLVAVGILLVSRLKRGTSR